MNKTMKRTMQIVTVLLLAIVLISFTTNVFAAITPSELKPAEVDTGDLKTTAQRVMGFIRNIAVIASVIIIMVLGVKYMLGSVEEKAEYKKSFMPLIIGIILVVAATSIATFIFNIAGN